MVQALQGFPIIKSNERPRIWRYSYSAGPVRSKFLLHLRDDQQIMGTKCRACGRVYVPARSTCLRCFEDLSEWVEVKDEGVLETYTIVEEPSLHLKDTPVAFGVIKLDGADTGIVHRLGDLDFGQIYIGMRVKAVFGEEVKGDIRDIMHFRPADAV